MDERDYATFRGAQVAVDVEAMLAGLAVTAAVAVFLPPIWILFWLFSLSKRTPASS